MLIDYILFDYFHVDEKLALIQFSKSLKKLPSYQYGDKKDLDGLSDEQFCYFMLKETSRSFTFVINLLDRKIRTVVCVFYLCMRALDTIEDDMEPKNLDDKLELLRNFHNLIQNKDLPSKDKDYGEGMERYLLKNIKRLLTVYHSLADKYKEIIRDTVRTMGNGVAPFCNKEFVSVDTMEMYDKYVYCVAGVVGEGLTRIFVASGLESKESFEGSDKCAKSMGKFLQKTNIIKDYLCDLNEKRSFWPSEIWSKYAKSIDFFAKNPDDPKSLECVNEMIVDALRLLPDCCEYLKQIKNKSIFRFCAIPQVMGLSTLNLFYNNKMVFKSSLKIRRGYTAKVFSSIENYADFERFLFTNCVSLANKMRKRKESAALLDLCRSTDLKGSLQKFNAFDWFEIALVFFFVALWK